LIAFSLSPWLIGLTGGAAGLFLFQGALAAMNLVVVAARYKGLSEYADLSDDAGAERATATPVSSGLSVDLSTRFLAYGAGFLLGVCDISVWTFAAPIAQQAHISLSAMGGVFTICAIVGFFGPLLAAWTGFRFGLLFPIAAAQITMIATSLIVVSTHDATAFQLALFTRVFAILFLIPIYQGLLARVDPSGRLIAGFSAVAQVGYTVGPLIGGLVISIETHDFLKAGILSSVAAGLSMVSVLLVVRRNLGAIRENRELKVSSAVMH
jgi:MFS family permease